MKTTIDIKTLAARFIDRAGSRVLLYGKARDEAALEYFIGAATLAELTGQNSLATRLTKVCAHMIAVRGFAAVRELADADIIVED